MLIHLDTSVLIDAFTGERRSLPALRDASVAGDIITFSTVVLYEWLRGPRTDAERAAVEAFVDAAELVSFGVDEAECAALLYRRVRSARQRQADLAVAACALTHAASLWTLNAADFRDVPGLTLYAAQSR